MFEKNLFLDEMTHIMRTPTDDHHLQIHTTTDLGMTPIGRSRE